MAAAGLSPIYFVSSQDVSRLCLSRALVHGQVTIGDCAKDTIDKARFGGRTYSDKAPGMSVLDVAPVVLTRLPAPAGWHASRDPRLWLIRVLTSGVAFLLLALACGRLAEGLAPGSGGFVLVCLALATPLGALAATDFGHVTAAALGFFAFLFAWQRRDVLGGVLAGCAVLVEYQAALIALLLAVYIVVKGRRRLLAYALGGVPGAVILAAYDWAAFRSPFHVSYRYVANRFAKEQAGGFFGIGRPRWHSVAETLFDGRGLLLTSPILVAAGVGLVLLARRHRTEAVLCAAVFAAFLLLEFGYFLPYGGTSPGPRFLVPALPFLALGLGPAYARFPFVTALLALPSLVASIAVELTWSVSPTINAHTIWRELWQTLAHGSDVLHSQLAGSPLTFVGATPVVAAWFVAVCAAAALAVAVGSSRSHRSS